MKVYKSLDEIGNIPNPVITIGTFDGVHLGHQKIISQINEEAKAIGGESVLFSFFPHPRMVLYPDSHGLKLIQTQDEKLKKLEVLGLHNLIEFPFTYEFSRLTALEFVRDILFNKLNVKRLVIGYDHQFGKNREGTIAFLQSVAVTYDFEVIQIPAEVINDINISSTKIRTAIKQGDMLSANAFLGDAFNLQGVVVEGNRLGRTIGFPTANIGQISNIKLLPARGVYAVQVILEGKRYNGMVNLGFRPTVVTEGMEIVEVHIFDFNEDIYGKVLILNFYQRIREEKKFDNLEQLKQQLMSDEKEIRTLFASFADQ